MTLARYVSLFLIPFAAALTFSEVNADTFGLPPNTEFEREWKSTETTMEGAHFLAVRTADEWAAVWKKHAPNDKEPPAVDFTRWMVVGIATPAKQRPRAIYRIELDDAAKPTELRVRVAEGGFSQRPMWSEIKATRVHFAATGKCAFPVQFINDIMVDAAAPANEGVDTQPLARVDGVKPIGGKARANNREDAEKFVRATLTAEEIAKLRTQIWNRPRGFRYPELWSIIQVRRGEKTWEIDYDGLRFTVDVQTGEVKRGPWKWAPRPPSSSL